MSPLITLTDRAKVGGRKSDKSVLLETKAGSECLVLRKESGIGVSVNPVAKKSRRSAYLSQVSQAPPATSSCIPTQRGEQRRNRRRHRR